MTQKQPLFVYSQIRGGGNTLNLVKQNIVEPLYIYTGLENGHEWTLELISLSHSNTQLSIGLHSCSLLEIVVLKGHAHNLFNKLQLMHSVYS